MQRHYPAELKDNPSVGIKISIFAWLFVLSLKTRTQAASLTAAASSNAILWIDILDPIVTIVVALVGILVAVSGVIFAYRKDKRDQEAHDKESD